MNSISSGAANYPAGSDALLPPSPLAGEGAGMGGVHRSSDEELP